LPFEVTPFMFYLTRQGERPSPEAPAVASANSESDPKP
jgi:hypothetical protein